MRRDPSGPCVARWLSGPSRTVMAWPQIQPPNSTPTSPCWLRCSVPGRARAPASTRRSTTSRTWSRSPSPMSASRSWPTPSARKHPDTGAPMHAESGYLRVPRPGSIEIVMAQPTGLAEIYEGAVVGGDAPLVIDVRSTSIGSTHQRQGGDDHRTDDLGDRRRPPLHVPHGRSRPTAAAPPERHCTAVTSGRVTSRGELVGEPVEDDLGALDPVDR